MSIEIRTATSRSRTEEDGRRTWHSFSFGAHYDPANTGFAAITALNDENLDGGAGYGPHRHTDVEILTWVLDGALRHTDSTGYATVLAPGEVFRTSAGSGIVHSEVAEPGVPTRFLQTWLRPDVPGRPPSFASGLGDPSAPLDEIVGPGGLTIGARGARLLLGTVTRAVELPDAPAVQVFVVSGSAVIGDRALGAGDAARLNREGGRVLQVDAAATLAVWAFGQ